MIYILTSGCNSLYIRLDTSEPVRAFSTTIKTNLSIFQKSKHCKSTFLSSISKYIPVSVYCLATKGKISSRAKIFFGLAS